MRGVDGRQAGTTFGLLCQPVEGEWSEERKIALEEMGSAN